MGPCWILVGPAMSAQFCMCGIYTANVRVPDDGPILRAHGVDYRKSLLQSKLLAPSIGLQILNRLYPICI